MKVVTLEDLSMKISPKQLEVYTLEKGKTAPVEYEALHGYGNYYGYEVIDIQLRVKASEDTFGGASVTPYARVFVVKPKDN